MVWLFISDYPSGQLMTDHVLTLNAGSATIKFALFTISEHMECVISGTVDGIGTRLHLALDKGSKFTAQPESVSQPATNHIGAMALILNFLNRAFDSKLAITAIGHRIVHGGLDYVKPAKLDQAVIANLAKLAPFAPLHQLHNLAGVKAAGKEFPDALQYGCFDTAFHRSHPRVSDTFALPRRYYDEGVRRYGFHGLSYEHIVRELGLRSGDVPARVIIAHLGNGASLCAMKDGRSMASSMGFSPLDGVPMGTRCGQIDPGVLLYMMQQQKMSANDIQDLLYKESGLKGLSGISNDMRVLLQSGDKAAEEAIDYFIHHVRREIGAMTATLGGLDTLVFTGGIGENAAPIRRRICANMNWLGIKLDEAQNRDGATVISTGQSNVEVLVIKTNEELTIARHAKDFL
jgi:acetate kinase